jgi:hypothetical protein
MSLFDLAQVMLTFRAFRRDDTTEMANLKADAAYPPLATPDNLAGAKCLNFNFRHDVTRAAETPEM